MSSRRTSVTLLCPSSSSVHRSPSQHSSQRVPKNALILIPFILQQQNRIYGTGPRSKVGKVSDCRRLLTAKSSAMSSNPVWFHTWVEIGDHGLISIVFLLPSAESRKVVFIYKRKYVHEVLVNRFTKLAHEKVWLGELTVLTWP